MKEKEKDMKEKTKSRTISVLGKGRLRMTPDTTRITMTLEGVRPDYGAALRRSAEDTDKLRELFSGFRFARTDLKTLLFDVDTEYESVQEDGVFRQRFAGYRYRHQLKVEFRSDSDRLGEILQAIADCPAHPEVRISYTVADREAAANRLLAAAVQDAAEKAAVLARAAGVTLKGIRSIDCAPEEPELESRPMNRAILAEARMSAKAVADYAADLTPDDVEAAAAVSVVWEIE